MQTLRSRYAQYIPQMMYVALPDMQFIWLCMFTFV